MSLNAKIVDLNWSLNEVVGIKLIDLLEQKEKKNTIIYKFLVLILMYPVFVDWVRLFDFAYILSAENAGQKYD